MPSEPSPSVNGHELWRIPTEEALDLVDQKLGPPEAWGASALLSYRLSADFQADWKAEVGHWMHAAKTFGFLDSILRQVFGERDRRRVNTDRNAGDRRHLKLHQYLSEALFTHYFTGLGWSFSGWNTTPGEAIDIDLALKAPDDSLVELQIKTPDEPGDLVNGQYQGGNSDQHVVAALNKAADQLPKPARSVGMVALFPQRNFSLTGNPRCLIKHLFGQCYPENNEPVLPRTSFGQFMSGSWNHIAGVVIVDLLRGANFVENGNSIELVNGLVYPCTVLLNPLAERPADPNWFPKARVLWLDQDRFRWARGEPCEPIHGLPDGTRVVEQLAP